MDYYDIPPLEDMSKVILTNNKSTFNKIETTSLTPKDILQDKNPDPVANIDYSDFGGFKKGFLSKVNKNESAIPFITAKKENPLKLKELKMDDILEQHKNDLVELVENDKDLCAMLLDSKYSKALDELKTNPQLAMIKYKDDYELQSFIQRFSKILGIHFENLAKTENVDDSNASLPFQENITLHKQIDRDVLDILNDEELRNILLDDEIKNFINLLRENPNKAQNLFYSRDANFKKKIDKLVQSGLMQFEQYSS